MAEPDQGLRITHLILKGQGGLSIKELKALKRSCKLTGVQQDLGLAP